MGTAIVIKEMFNRGGWLTVSEVQSIMVIAGSRAVFRQPWDWSMLVLLQVTGS